MSEVKPQSFWELLRGWNESKMKENMRNTIKLILSIFVCELAGILGSFFTAPAIKTWYVFLEKPSFSPPNWIFGPVWVLLYALMGIAIYLVWPKVAKIFSIQLIVNALWSISFFGLKNPLLGLINIVVLWVLILILLFKFYRLNRISFWLFMPYFLWVSFASVLNFYIYLLN